MGMPRNGGNAFFIFPKKPFLYDSDSGNILPAGLPHLALGGAKLRERGRRNHESGHSKQAPPLQYLSPTGPTPPP